MQEVELGGIKYRTGAKLNAFDQFHVFCKIAPLLSGMGETFTQLPTGGFNGAAVPSGFWSALEPAAKELSKMPKADSEFVLKTCLSSCVRDNGAGSWVRIMADSGQLMFDDIDMMVMLNLTWAVVQENLGNFFGGPSPNGSAGEAATSPPSLSLR